MSSTFKWAAGLLVLGAGPALAQDVSPEPLQFTMNTLFIAICAILVMWMMAGFAMIEAGLVSARNAVTQCTKNIGLFAIATTGFLLCGYGLMFPNGSWIIPSILGSPTMVELGTIAASDTEFAGLDRAEPVDILFQMMFSATVASIVSGALAGRTKLSSFFLFTAVLTAIIYPIQASWSWGGGFLTTQFGFIDLAGSTVVHVAGGTAALVGSIIVGARAGRYENGITMPVASFNLPMATLGALILWMGWFGFNAGSYLSFSSEADAWNVSRILLNTNMAGAGGVLGAALISYMKYYRFDLSFMLNGALAGLVSITAEPLFPTPILAMLIGVVGGVIVVWAVVLLDSLKIDDVVGAAPVHLFCGVWGTIAVILSNPEATLVGQILPIAIVMVFVGGASFAAWMLLKATIGVRVSAESEAAGIDESEMVLEL